MSADFRNPPLDTIDHFLRDVRRIAVVGLSPKPTRPSHRIAAWLLECGFEVIPVRPAVDAVLGQKAYPDLASAPGPIDDLVDCFRASRFVSGVVDDCLRLGIPGLWLQDGIVDLAAARRAREADMLVVMDDCIGRIGRKLGWGESKPHG